jgi:hypothetical protein
VQTIRSHHYLGIIGEHMSEDGDNSVGEHYWVATLIILHAPHVFKP